MLTAPFGSESNRVRSLPGHIIRAPPISQWHPFPRRVGVLAKLIWAHFLPPQIWYARYIDWTITTPLLLLDLLLATGLPLSNIFSVVFFDLVMIITGLIGALAQSSYKWGYYAFGCAAMFYIFWALVFPARKCAYAISAEAGRAYTKSAAILLVLWISHFHSPQMAAPSSFPLHLLYPIAWAVADGGNVIAPDSEMVFYGVLDV